MNFTLKAGKKKARPLSVFVSELPQLRKILPLTPSLAH